MLKKKEKFTIKERLMVYEKAIKLYKTFYHKNSGACMVIQHAVLILYGKLINIYKIPKAFPEFGLFKPEDAMFDDLWFENDHERLIALRLCILMLKR